MSVSSQGAPGKVCTSHVELPRLVPELTAALWDPPPPPWDAVQSRARNNAAQRSGGNLASAAQRPGSSSLISCFLLRSIAKSDLTGRNARKVQHRKAWLYSPTSEAVLRLADCAAASLLVNRHAARVEAQAMAPVCSRIHPWCTLCTLTRRRAGPLGPCSFE